MKTTLIAPCGMNCALCRAYGREKDGCPGCYYDRRPSSRYRAGCRIKNCRVIKGGKRFCFACGDYPCARLKQLDKRYRTRYSMSMIDNLESIKQTGVREFVRSEKRRWACPGCGRTLTVHRECCPACGHRWR